MVKSFVYGVGINDADYAVTSTRGGKKSTCKIYKKWQAMLERCYSDRLKKVRPSYVGCEVSDNWIYFSNFREWMITQDWEGNDLDKDIITPGNKLYSIDTCAFVTPTTNCFVTDDAAKRGKFLIGTYFNKPAKKFIATCSNPFTKKPEHLGVFKNEIDAHEAWRTRKHELACQLAKLQSDKRVAEALRVRYLKS